MAATAQKTANFNITGGNVHNAVLNPQGSKTFVKKIVPVALTFILHQRLESDGADYETRTYEGINFNVFKTVVRNPILREIENWIKGALDALDKNYLRQLYLVLASKDDPDLIYESYKFEFKYMGDDVVQFDTEPTEEELKQSTSEMLKAIDSLEEYKKYNERELELKMALTYYEDVTPLEYRPQFYNNEADDGDTFFSGLDMQPRDYLHLGSLKTGFHILKCRAKGQTFSLNQILSGIHSTEAAFNKLGTSSDVEIINIDLTEIESTPILEHDAIVRSAVNCSTSELSERDNLAEENILCMCNISAMFSQIDLVLCSKCLFYQHCVCMGYLQRSDVSDTYVCAYCDDTVYWTPKTEATNKECSIYRLIIASAYLTGKFPKEVFNQLPVDKQCAVIEKLKKLTIVYEENGNYRVNKYEIEIHYLKQLFENSYKNLEVSDSMTLGSLETPRKRRKVLRGKSSAKKSA